MKENTPDKANKPNVCGDTSHTLFKICQSVACFAPNTVGHIPGTFFCQNIAIGIKNKVAGTDM